ncbi:type II secretion system protein [Candidatus Parcubacteria bacterium]|nr:MAG: type II secretion system protein [Candidatus Parcubacteria bacterium]
MNEKGFTLLELLVVVAIIGIMSTIAVVNLNSSRDKAKEVKILAEMSNKQKIAQVCSFSGLELNCGNYGDCNPDNRNNDDTSANYTPYPNRNICALGDNSVRWDNFAEYGWSWYRALSNTEELTYCFGIKKDGENKYISCAEDVCHLTNTLTCHLPCDVNGIACNLDVDCCSGYCDVNNICNDPPVLEG